MQKNEKNRRRLRERERERERERKAEKEESKGKKIKGNEGISGWILIWSVLPLINQTAVFTSVTQHLRRTGRNTSFDFPSFIRQWPSLPLPLRSTSFQLQELLEIRRLKSLLAAYHARRVPARFARAETESNRFFLRWKGFSLSLSLREHFNYLQRASYLLYLLSG